MSDTSPAHGTDAAGLVSVIVPVLHPPLLGQVLQALRRQTARERIAEVLVVGLDRDGQAVPDGLVRVIPTDGPRLAAASRNIGLAQARGEHCLFLDADCILEPDALERLLALLEQGYDAVNPAWRPEREHYWRLCHNLMAFPERSTLDRSGPRTLVIGYCMLVRRSVMQAVGPFQDHLNCCEDLEWSFRAQRLGCRFGFAADAVLYHRPARTDIATVWRRHVTYGLDWYPLYQRYAGELPFSQAVWLAERAGGLWAAAFVLLALLYVLRMAAGRSYLWRRYWYALPGMAWSQLGWYHGLRRGVERSRASAPGAEVGKGAGPSRRRVALALPWSRGS